MAVFIPILLMGGHRRAVVPRVRDHALGRPFGISLVVSLTTTPMLCARILRAHNQRGRPTPRPAWLSRPRANGVFRLDSANLRTLTDAGSLRHQLSDAHGHARSRSAFTIHLYIIIPKGVLPAARHRDDSSASLRAGGPRARRFNAMRAESALRSSPRLMQRRSRPWRHRHARRSAAAAGPAAAVRGTSRECSSRSNRASERNALGRSPSLRASAGQTSRRSTGAGLVCRWSRRQDIRIGGRVSSARSFNTRSAATTLTDLAARGSPKLLRERFPHPPASSPTCSTTRSTESRPAKRSSEHRSRHARQARPQRSRCNKSTTTLYDAFGQRQVSTMYKSLNQYRVVMGGRAGVLAESRCSLKAHLCRRSASARKQHSAQSTFATDTSAKNTSLSVNALRACSLRRRPSPSTSPVGTSLGDATDGVKVERTAEEIGTAGPRSTAASRGHAASLSARRWTSQPLADSRGVDHGVYRARRALRKLYPSDHDPLDAALRPASARCWR